MTEIVNQYHCRPYKNSDYNRLCEIHDTARLDELSFTHQLDAFIPLVEAAKNEHLFSYSIAVAENNHRIDGFIAYTDNELGWLYVYPEAYRQGIATLLTNYVIQHAGPDIYVEVLHTNTPALKLYQKLGFRLTQTKSGRMAGNETFKVTIQELKYCRPQ